MTTLPLCDLTDLPRLLCAHCDGFSMTGSEMAYLRGEHKPEALDRETLTHHSIPPQPYRFDYPRGGGWLEPEPVVILCDHGHSEDRFICTDCEEALMRAVGDVPALVEDLEIAHAKQVSFVQQGAPLDADPDEATLDWSEGASRALGDLSRALGGDPVQRSRVMLQHWHGVMQDPNLQQLAARVTEAVRLGHAVIERPPEPVHYGKCPDCKIDITQERLREETDLVHCQCGYHATLKAHQHAQLELGQERWMTITELVAAFEDGGEPIKRSTIQSMIDRQGLPREYRQVPKWTRGVVVQHEVSVYKLGDVRDMVDQRNERKAS